MAGKEDPMEDSHASTLTDKAVAAAAGNNVGEEEPPKEEQELVEMPEDYLRWLLAQTRETDPVPTLDDYSTRDPVKLKRLQEEIDWLQAEPSRTTPSGSKLGPATSWISMAASCFRRMRFSPEEFQEAINEYWYGLLREYGNNGGDSKTEVEAAVPSD